MEVITTEEGNLSPVQQQRIKMVEKIREPYQKHARNISTVSDISTAGSIEPLKRDENAEIRCVVLCDSDTERNCVFECFYKSIIGMFLYIRNI